MFLRIKLFLARIFFCTFSFHTGDDKIQSSKEYNVHCCDRCGTMFVLKKEKYKNSD